MPVMATISSKLGRQMSLRPITSVITARALSFVQSLRRRLVSNETSAPPARAASIAA